MQSRRTMFQGYLFVTTEDRKHYIKTQKSRHLQKRYCGQRRASFVNIAGGNRDFWKIIDKDEEKIIAVIPSDAG